jgi:selenide,water dikinase
MLRLNRVAARVARDAGAAGATDITGFGFLGHAGEMVAASGAGLAVDTSRLPFLPHARALAEAGHFSGGMKRNRRYLEAVFGARLEIAADVPAVLVSLLMEAETSGGLLFSVRPERAGGVRDAFRATAEEAWEIGEVLAAPVLRLRG